MEHNRRGDCSTENGKRKTENFSKQELGNQKNTVSNLTVEA
jgi:hypothetical protein